MFFFITVRLIHIFLFRTLCIPLNTVITYLGEFCLLFKRHFLSLFHEYEISMGLNNEKEKTCVQI